MHISVARLQNQAFSDFEEVLISILENSREANISDSKNKKKGGALFTSEECTYGDTLFTTHYRDTGFTEGVQYSLVNNVWGYIIHGDTLFTGIRYSL